MSCRIFIPEGLDKTLFISPFYKIGSIRRTSKSKYFSKKYLKFEKRPYF